MTESEMHDMTEKEVLDEAIALLRRMEDAEKQFLRLQAGNKAQILNRER